MTEATSWFLAQSQQEQHTQGHLPLQPRKQETGMPLFRILPQSSGKSEGLSGLFSFHV